MPGWLIENTILVAVLSLAVAVFYDVRGAWLVSPMVNYIFEPFRFMIQYTGVMGNFTGIGAFRDRDQLSFIFTYLLN